ncbi:hypothetical protein [Streptomyces sp. NPDC001744]|uniref:hypothetical protein n=1 Tax=Streptomyces sp. NPDC001744 TaxID=3364606 RepID=UPI0036B26EB4
MRQDTRKALSCGYGRTATPDGASYDNKGTYMERNSGQGYGDVGWGVTTEPGWGVCRGIGWGVTAG